MRMSYPANLTFISISDKVTCMLDTDFDDYEDDFDDHDELSAFEEEPEGGECEFCGAYLDEIAQIVGVCDSCQAGLDDYDEDEDFDFE